MQHFMFLYLMVYFKLFQKLLFFLNNSQIIHIICQIEYCLENKFLGCYKVTRDSRPNAGSDLLIQKRLV